MKVFRLSLIVALAAIACAVPITEPENRLNGENGWYVPQVDGTFEWIDAKKAAIKLEALELNEAARLPSLAVKFYLYTQANPNEGIEIASKNESIKRSTFNATNPTKFVIHGWNSNYKDGLNRYVRQVWLQQRDHNIISVDWPRGRSLEYISSVSAVNKTGETIAQLIDFLQQNHGLSLHTLDVIGHSLGAHVAGQTGKHVKTGQVYTIFGLDPAMPLISYNNTALRLNSSDAYYVETIQTSGGLLGYIHPIGKATFYPNGGQSQPGCGLDLTGSCAHSRSVLYYLEAVERNNFAAVKCESYENAAKNKCGTVYDDSVRMVGSRNPENAAGYFYVPVNSETPFGMGF